jgi:hypothetical protein
MRRASLVALLATLGIIAGCSKVPTPTAPSAPSSVVVTPAIQTPVLRIVVPPVVPFGSTIPLHTEIHTGEIVTDCSSSTALWKTTSDGGDVGVVSYADNRVIAGPAFLYTRGSGFLTLTATCDGLTATTSIRVEGTWLPTRITTGDDAPGLEYMPTGSSVEILDGPRAGVRVPEDQFVTVTGFTFPLTVRLTAPFYAPKDYVINRYAPQAKPPVNEELYVKKILLTYVGGGSSSAAFLAQGKDYRESPDATYPFTVKAAGTIEVATQWHKDFEDQYKLITELWCGGQMLHRDTEDIFSPSPSVRFRETVAEPGACEIRVHRNSQAYRITVTFPR